MRQEAEIITKYANENNAGSSRKLASALSEHPDCYFSHTAVMNWLNDDSLPTDDNLGLIIGCYDDWRKDMAIACIKARRDRYARMVEGAHAPAPASD